MTSALCRSNSISSASTPSDITRKKTIIVSECVLVYLEEESVHRLKALFRSTLANFVLVDYEMFNPDDAFGRRMVINFGVF